MRYSHLMAGAFALSLQAFGGTIVTSGDSSIAAGVSGGNATFFQNVLGAGTSVLIQELDSGTAGYGGSIANYYNGLGGVTATQSTAASITSLAGVNLFISMLPQSAYSSGEISAMQSLLASGGTIFFIGESTGYGPGGIADPIITSTLATLGSTMTMAGNDHGTYPTGATVLANPLTAGVSSFTYGFTSFITGGTPLFDTVGGTPFIAVESVGGAATPEPVTGLMTLGGLAGLGLLARRKKSV